MNLTLYKTTNADNVINKVKTDDYAVVINLKKDTNWLNPEILLASIAGVDFKDYNYCHLDVVNKFYFIRSIEAMGNRISKLICECDYLETYKADILASNAAFRKQVEPGDYGSIDLENTGRDTIANYNSDTSLVAANTIILSTMGVK